MSLEKIKQDRLKKLEAIRLVGVNPYPGQAPRARQEIFLVLENFDAMVIEKKDIVLAGRLRLIREHGTKIEQAWHEHFRHRK